MIYSERDVNVSERSVLATGPKGRGHGFLRAIKIRITPSEGK
jgi:hypothetical protein